MCTFYPRGARRSADGRRVFPAGGLAGSLGPGYDAIELGYALVPSARGFGFATEAARAVLAAASEVFDFANVRARCDRDNLDSAAVLLRCGMTEVESPGTQRHFEMPLRKWTS